MNLIMIFVTTVTVLSDTWI